ncbi:hypothetical protein [Bacteroides sp. 224]|uniref:hypothetical protein n=1 Tax=Bacteroides sp. 224 TaxID=2302936 RepID=UPI0013D7956D|nr:hypothetical protein [Bacteroides sp. 224]NDV63971.1 hypothetical protein [Bacteroides sp. 224]
MNAVSGKPGDSDFSEEFIKRSRIHPLEYNIYRSILSGQNPYTIIEQLVGNLNEVHEELKNIKLHGLPPIYVVVSESTIQELKTKINETSD